MPQNIVPMLAVPASDLPSDRGAYHYEYKWDGVRAIAYWDGRRLRLSSRNGNEITHRYPELGNATASLVRSADEKEVHPEHTVKGYEIAPDQYVIIEESELEAVPLDSLEGVPRRTQADSREVKMAEQLIESLYGKFNPHKYKDEYTEAVKKMIERKADGDLFEKEKAMRYPIGLYVSVAAVSLLAGCARPGAVAEAKRTQNADELVRMSGFAFVPKHVTIKVGQSVEWNNTAALEAHTVTADPALAKTKTSVSLPPGAATFNSGDLKPGQTFRYVFTVPGTYRYFCIPHERMGMIGEVEVQAVPAAQP